MTSSVAVIQLTYDGVDILDIDGIHLELVQGLFESATTRGIDVTVPGADGQVARPRRFHERQIVLDGFVRGSGTFQDERQSSYRANLDTLVALFEEGGGASVQPKVLEAITEDGLVRWIPARTVSRIQNEAVKGEFTLANIELLAVRDWTVEAPGS